MIKVLFVCLGNICRSPTAHGVFREHVERSGLSQTIWVDSAGTGDWHLGEPPDKRATAEAKIRGIDISDLRSRLVTKDDFLEFDYVLAMDKQNLKDLQAMAPTDYNGTLSLFLPFAADANETEVPDPYYGGDEGFTHVFDLVDAASKGLLNSIAGHTE